MSGTSIIAQIFVPLSQNKNRLYENILFCLYYFSNKIFQYHLHQNPPSPPPKKKQ